MLVSHPSEYLSFLFMLTKGSHACRGLSFFTIRREQLGAKVNAMGHPTSISCQQLPQLLHSSEVTVGRSQLSHNVQRVFRICLREAEMKRAGQRAFKGEIFHATKRTEALTATENVPSHLGTSPLCSPSALLRTVWGELKPNADHVKPSVHMHAFPAVLGSSSHVIYVFFYLHSTKPQMSFHWLDGCGLPLLM